MQEVKAQRRNEEPAKFKTGSSRHKFKSALEANIGYEFLPLINKALAPFIKTSGKTRQSLLDLKDKLLEAESSWMVDDYRDVKVEDVTSTENPKVKDKKKASTPDKVHLVEALLPIDWIGLREEKKYDYATVARFVNVKFFPPVLIKFASDYLNNNLKITPEVFIDEYFHWVDKQLNYAVPKSKRTINEWSFLNISGKALNLYQSSASAFTVANAIHNMCGILNVREKIREHCAFVEEAHRYVRVVTSQGVIPFFYSYKEQMLLYGNSENNRLHRLVLYVKDSPLRKAFEAIEDSLREAIDNISPDIISPKLKALRGHINRKFRNKQKEFPSFVITADTQIFAKHIFDYLSQEFKGKGLTGLLLLSDDPQESREVALSALEGKQADFIVTTNLNSIPVGVLKRATEIAPLEQKRTRLKMYPWVSELISSAVEVLVVAFSIRNTVDTYRRESVHGSKKSYVIDSERFIDIIANPENDDDPFGSPPSLIFLHGLSAKLSECLSILDTEKKIKKSGIQSIKDIVDYGNRELTKYDLIEVDKKQIKTSLQADAMQHFKRSFDLLNSESDNLDDNMIACASGFQLLWKGLDFPENPTEFEIVFHEAILGGLIKFLDSKDRSQFLTSLPEKLAQFLEVRVEQGMNWATAMYSAENDAKRGKRLLRLAHRLEVFKENLKPNSRHN